MCIRDRIYAIATNRIIDASFGYFIMPILSVMLGYLFFKEKLNKKRVFSILLVVISILFLIIVSIKSLPWVGIIVAFSWSFYNLVRKKIIPILENMYPGCSKRINSFAEKMSNYKNEQNDLSKLASLYCEDAIGLKRELLNSLCIEARCTILNTFLKKDCTKQLSSKNLTHLASSILEKDKGKIDLPDGFEVVWNKDYINLEKN